MFPDTSSTPRLRPFMQFKDVAAEREWDRLVGDVADENKLVWSAVEVACNWTAYMEAALQDEPNMGQEAFNVMADRCLNRADNGFSFKQFAWIATWIRRCWLHGHRIDASVFCF